MKRLLIAGIIVCLLPSGLLAQWLFDSNRIHRDILDEQREQTRLLQQQLRMQRQLQWEQQLREIELERQRQMMMRETPLDSFLRGYKAGRNLFRGNR